MKSRFNLFSGIILFGLMSCSSFHTFETDINAINSHTGASRASAAVSPDTRKFDHGELLEPKIVLRDTPEVRKYLSLYTGRARKDIEEPLKRRAEHLPTIEKVLSYFELPLDLSNLVFIESKFDVSARSPQGAVGLWQFMKPTAQGLGLRCNFWNDEREDVLRSSIAAAKYLKDLQNKFDDWLLTLAAYNAGPGRILSAIEKAGGERDFYEIAKMNLLPQETVNHVSRFIALSMITRNPDVYDFGELSETWLGDVPLND